MWQLSAGEQQKVEIVKALLQGADVLVLDEPTSVLTPPRRRSCSRVVRRMTAEGHAVIFISHKLEEVLAICTRVVVLRRGRRRGRAPIRGQVDRRELARMMVGREVLFSLERKAAAPGEVVLEVRRPVVARRPRARGGRGRLPFRPRRARSSASPACRATGSASWSRRSPGCAARPAARCAWRARDITNASARVASDLGISHVPEERIRYGIVANLLVYENAVLKQHREPALLAGAVPGLRAIRGHAEDIVASYHVEPPRSRRP